MLRPCVIVLTTFPAEGDAASLAETLVAERLAACVNLLPPMQSVYRWQGEVEQAAERQLIIKTTAASVERLQARLIELHPYDVPEFLVLTVSDVSETYLRWLEESADGADDTDMR
jgi:periplasmic divalent cation tolerance protein